jgi:hypothetical protein
MLPYLPFSTKDIGVISQIMSFKKLLQKELPKDDNFTFGQFWKFAENLVYQKDIYWK